MARRPVRAPALPLLLLLLPAVVSPALAGEAQAPLCGRPSVLEGVRTALAEAGRRIEFDPVPVGEVSTGPGPVVSCAARAHVIAYDTNRYGAAPVREETVLLYTLERRRNGIFLRLR